MMNAKANQLRFCANPDVVFYVGQPAVAFYLELDVMCDVSPVLKAALTGGFKESVEKTMRFPEENPIEFHRFLKWTYLDTYFLSPFQSDGTAEVRMMELARLYVLADRLDVVKLKHNIIDRMYEIGQCSSSSYGPPHRVIRYIYANSTRTCSFRKLLVAWYFKTRRLALVFGNRELDLENELPDLVADIELEASTRGVMNPFLCDRRVFYEGSPVPLSPNRRY